MRMFGISLLVIWSVAMTPTVAMAEAKTVRLSPPAGCATSDGIVEAAKGLRPGDALVLAPGVYCRTGRRLIEARGTAERPIVIRGAGPGKSVLTRPGAPSDRHRFDGTEVRGAHLILRNLHFRGGKRGLVFHGGSHHVTLEDSEVSHTSNNGITLNNGDTHHFVIRRNRIHHTGNLDPALGPTEGEGMYIGCHDASCIAHDHLIEANEIYDLRANGSGGNDGIEIKYGSYGNIVRNNVIHTIHPAFEEVRYPGVFAYGTLDAQRDRPNLIEGNVIWGCGEAIQVVSDAVVRHNVVLNSQRALAVYYHRRVPAQRNLRITGNIFFGSRLDLQFGLQKELADDPNAVRKPPPVGIVFADNAIFGPGLRPLVTVDLPRGGGVTVRNNTVGALAPSVLVIERDPQGIIGPNAFVQGGRAH